MIIKKIFGIPGSGKTTELMRLVEEDVKSGVPLTRIAYLSFSRAAKDVIKERMNAKEADLIWFRTLHGAATKVLGLGQAIITPHDYRSFSEKTGLLITPESDDFQWSSDAPLDYNVTLRALNLAATKMIAIEDVIRALPPHRNLTLEQVKMFDRKWTEYKRQIGKFDFGDMLTKFHREGTPLDIDRAYVDEAQDMSELQWACTHIMIANAKVVVMAGDDDQAIYPFIGGSEYAFLDHPSDEETVLDCSHRVPIKIGQAADQIIRRVDHRKHKTPIWKDVPGEIRRMNWDGTTIPWRSYLEKYESIMVLTRHRAGARRFSDDLKLVGIPHKLNGESVQQWREAKLLHAYLTLRDGGKVTPHMAQELCDELGIDNTALRELNRRKKIGRDLVLLDYDTNWLSVFTNGNKAKRKRYEVLQRLVNHQGPEVLAKDEKIAIGTMHGAKGKEADLIIIVPDCNNIVRQNVYTPAEIRLSYVTLTRAKRDAIVLMPQTDTYIPHFFGG